MSLFQNVAFKATQGDTPFKYLGVIADDGESKGYLSYSTNAVLTKNAKFAVTNAHNANSGLVHIRSCLNNKYWVRSSTNGNWIVAQGCEPEDDHTSWTCTLFRMDIDDNKNATFYHVQSGNTVRIPNDGSDRKMFLTIDPNATTLAVSLAIDYDEFVILPKYVAFKGSNGLYYLNYSESSDKTQRFLGKDIGNPNIVWRIEYTSNGLIRVGDDVPNGFYWTYFEGMDFLSPAFHNDWNNNQFAPIRIHSNVIALRNQENKKICKRISGSSNDLDNCLGALEDGAVKDTHLEVVEPVIRRSVYSVEFNLDKARTYGLTLLYSDTHVWKNPTAETQNGTVDGRIITTKSKTYSNDVSVSGTVSTTIEAGVPFIADGKIEVSVSASYSHQWGETVNKEQQVGDIFSVVVPPRKKAIARGVATKGLCDVPFSYVQKDYPASGGPPIITSLYDGVFRGANAYGFDSDVSYEDLPADELPPYKDEIECYTIPAEIAPPPAY